MEIIDVFCPICILDDNASTASNSLQNFLKEKIGRLEC
jgi:hypothetical protein